MVRKSPRGRKTKYKVEWVEEVEELGRKGYIDNQMAAHFRIGLTTFYNYCNIYPEFKEAVEKGKKEADWKVKESVYKRAMGYNVVETEEIVDMAGNVLQKKVKKKHIPADSKFASMWLQNREPEEWREKQDIRAEVETDLVIDISFKSDEEDDE